MSSNPQPHSVYVRFSDKEVAKTHRNAGDTVNVDVDYYGAPVGVEVLGALSVTIDGQEARALPSFPEGDYVDKVTAVLNGYRHQLGPNTISLIRDGVWKSLPLSLGEMRDIAFLLHEAGLLRTPERHPEELVSQIAAVLKESESLVRDEQDYHQWCARRVLDAIRGLT